MAITARTATVAQGATVTTIAGTLPTGLANGDVLVAVFAVGSTSSALVTTGTSGWTQLFAPFTPTGVTGEFFGAYYRVVTDAATQTAPSWSWTTAGRATCMIQAYIGVNNTTPIDVAASTASAAGTSVTLPAITVATADARLVSGVISDSSNPTTNAFTVPTGMIKIAENTQAGGGRRSAMADETRATTGTTGTRVWSQVSNLAFGGFLVALRPAAGGTNVTSTGFASTSTAAAPTGAVKTGQTGFASTATAAAPAGTVTAGQAVAQTGFASTSTAAAPAGTVSTSSTASATGLVSAVTAAAPAGTTSATRAVALDGVTVAVPVDAPTGSVSTSNAGQATFFNETFENGSLGANMTTGNTTWTSLTGTPTFGTGLVGSLGMAVAASAASVYGRYDFSTTEAVAYNRFYFTMPAAPTATGTIAGLYTTGTARAVLSMTLAGKLQIRDGNTTIAGTTTMTFAANTTYRLEWMVSNISSTQQLRVYAGDSSTVLETVSGAYTQASTFNSYRLGAVSALTWSPTFDAVALSNTDWIGSAVTSTSISLSGVAASATALAPTGAYSAIMNVALTGFASTAAVSAASGSVALTSSAALTGFASSSTAAAPAGTVSTTVSATSTGLASTATAASPAGTVTANRAAVQAGVAATVTAAANAGSVNAVTPTLAGRWIGATTATSTQVGVVTANASSVRLKVSTSSDLLTSPVFSSSVTPDSTGFSKCTITGLSASTQYYYGVEMSGTTLVTSAGQFKTFPSGAASFSIGFGSCQNATDSTSWTRMLARNPLLFVHLGDFWYDDGSATTTADYIANHDAKLTATNTADFFHKVPVAYTWSDHDFGMNNNVVGTGFSGTDNAQAGYGARVPYWERPSADGGIYQTFVVGRVRFILTDNRSYKSSNSATDNSSKTILGTTQKQWFKDTITAATEPLIIWGNEQPWIGAAATPDDEWFAYNTERTELANYITASGKNVAIIAGDMHSLAADDGTNSPGGIPVMHSSPLNNAVSIKGGPYSEGTYGTGTAQQYGIITFTDSGSSLLMSFVGYDTNDVSRITLNKTYTIPQAASSSGVTATATAAAGTGSVTVTRTVAQTGPVSTATAAALAGTVSTTKTVTAAGLVSSSTAVALAGTVAAAQATTQTGLVSTATATTVAGSVLATRSATLAGAVSSASATALAGSVTATRAALLTGVPATVSAAAQPGSTIVGGSSTVQGVPAIVTATAPTGAVVPGKSLAVVGEVSVSTATAIAGTAGAGTSAVGVLVAATAQAPDGTVSTVKHLSLNGSTVNVAGVALAGTSAVSMVVELEGPTSSATVTARPGGVLAVQRTTSTGIRITVIAMAMEGAVSTLRPGGPRIARRPMASLERQGTGATITSRRQEATIT